MPSSLWPWQILTWPVQIRSRCCHKISSFSSSSVWPYYPSLHAPSMGFYFPAASNRGLSSLSTLSTCCPQSLSPIQWQEGDSSSEWVVNAKHSDNPFVPFLTLHLMLGRKFPWNLQTSSLFSVKLFSKTACFPHQVLKKKYNSQVCLLVCWFYRLANISSLFPFVPHLPARFPLFSQAFHLNCKVFGTETAFLSVLVLCSSDSCVRLSGCYGNISSKALNDNLV